MSRLKRHVHLLVAAAALTLGLLPVSPAAALTTPIQFAPGESLTADAVATAMQGQFPAAQISQGQWSPDHSHIAFRLDVPAQYRAIESIWVARADGTQATKLRETTQSHDESLQKLSWSAESSTVSWYYSYPNQHGVSRYEYEHVTTDSGTDTWSDGAGFDLWPHTDDGRYRVITSTQIGGGYGTTYSVQDLATGVTHAVLESHGAQDVWTPGTDCNSTGLAPTFGNIEAAVSGPFAPCSFAGGVFAPRARGEAAGDYSTVTTEPWGLWSPAPPPPGADYPAYAMSDAWYSPDRSHILFKVSRRSTPAQAGGSTTLLSQSYVVMRADGTQVHAFETTDATANAFAAGGAWTASGNAITFQVKTFVFPQTIRTEYARLTVAGGVDTWSAVPATDVGTLTADGRFRLVAPKVDGIPGTYTVVDVATGAAHPVLTQDENLTWAWIASTGCGSTGVAADPSLLASVLSGPSPPCVFATPPAAPRSVDTTTPATTPTPSPLSDVIATTPPPAPTPPARVAAPTTPKATTPAAGPALTFLASTTRLSAVRKSGLVVKFSATGAARVRVWLLPQGGRGESLARGTATKPASGGGALRIKLSKRGLATLAGLRRARLVLRLTATDAAGHTTTVDTPVQLGS